MVAIPPDTATAQDLQTWYVMQDQLRKLKADEMALRQRIFKTYFPNPQEGTNKYDLPDSYELNATYPITRDVDLGAFKANRERFVEAGINADTLVEYKASLLVSVYRKLTAEQTTLFDQCLVVKPGSPSMKIVLPAKAKKPT